MYSNLPLKLEFLGYATTCDNIHIYILTYASKYTLNMSKCI